MSVVGEIFLELIILVLLSCELLFKIEKGDVFLFYWCVFTGGASADMGGGHPSLLQNCLDTGKIYNVCYRVNMFLITYSQVRPIFEFIQHISSLYMLLTDSWLILFKPVGSFLAFGYEWLMDFSQIPGQQCFWLSSFPTIVSARNSNYPGPSSLLCEPSVLAAVPRLCFCVLS